MLIPAGAPDEMYRWAALLLIQDLIYDGGSALSASAKLETWWRYMVWSCGFASIRKIRSLMPHVNAENFLTLLDRHQSNMRQVMYEALDFHIRLQLPPHGGAPSVTRAETAAEIARMIGLVAHHMNSTALRGGHVSLTKAVSGVADIFGPRLRLEGVKAAGASPRQIKKHWAMLAPVRHIAMAYAMASPPTIKPEISLLDLFRTAEVAEESLPDAKYEKTRHIGAVLELDNALKVRVFNPEEQFEALVAQHE